MKKYDKYKESGIEWLGEIPINWSATPLKFLGHFINGFAFKSNEFVDFAGVRVVKISNIQHMAFDWSDESFVSSDYLLNENLEYRILFGDLLFALTRPIISSGIKAVINYSEEPMLLNQRNAIFRTLNDQSLKWIYYTMLNPLFIEQFDKKIDKTGQQPNISTKDIGTIQITFPPLPEQIQIAKYLDHQTGLIDQIIEKKEALIEKLKEQRQAIINEAVTKGLDPNAKMKDSGIEWLGEIPEGWQIIRLGLIGTFAKGKGITKSDIVANGEPCVRCGEIYTSFNRIFTKAKSHIESEYLPNTITVQKGTFLMAGDGETNEDIGKTVLYYGEAPINVGGGINTYIPNNKKVSCQFLSYSLNSKMSIFQKSRDGKGGIIVHIYAKQIKEHVTILPNLAEQEKISNYLNEKTSIIDKITKKNKGVIEKLKEQRQAIISEAVTGKIDVRDWQPKKNAIV